MQMNRKKNDYSDKEWQAKFSKAKELLSNCQSKTVHYTKYPLPQPQSVCLKDKFATIGGPNTSRAISSLQSGCPTSRESEYQAVNYASFQSSIELPLHETLKFDFGTEAFTIDSMNQTNPHPEPEHEWQNPSIRHRTPAPEYRPAQDHCVNMRGRLLSAKTFAKRNQTLSPDPLISSFRSESPSERFLEYATVENQNKSSLMSSQSEFEVFDPMKEQYGPDFRTSQLVSSFLSAREKGPASGQNTFGCGKLIQQASGGFSHRDRTPSTVQKFKSCRIESLQGDHEAMNSMAPSRISVKVQDEYTEGAQDLKDLKARVQEKIGALAAKRKTNKTVVKFNVDKKEIDFTPTNPYLNSIVTRKNVNGLRKTAKTEERAQSPIHELPQPQNFIPASKVNVYRKTTKSISEAAPTILSPVINRTPNERLSKYPEPQSKEKEVYSVYRESKPIGRQTTLRKNQMIERSPLVERNKENSVTMYLTPDKSDAVLNFSLEESPRRKASTINMIDEQLQEIERMLILHKKAKEEDAANKTRIENERNASIALSLATPRVDLISPRIDTRETSSFVSPRDSGTARERKYYEYVMDEITEQGKYTGEKYIGKRQGKGVFQYNEGYKYEGNWQNDEMSGYGVLTCADGKVLYAGDWNKGKFDGRGTLYNQNPTVGKFNGSDFQELGGMWVKYEGTFKDSKKNGMGTVSLVNGDLFVGLFVDDIVHGQGSYTKADGTTIVGLWQNNKLTVQF